MLLDTSFLIDLQRELAGGRARGAVRFFGSHPEATPWISLVTWMEFAEGYPPEKEDACRLFLSTFPLILPDPAMAWRASRLSRKLRASGSVIGDHDLWIAATALERGLPLVTRNPRHFRRIPELEILGY
ncbi:MAG: type II toxin-antitoxin system VapC family toxin [Planctomycetes bacterium]|nr:type II toxin-antitoxin system VapC family toxin [Planctomycetota bacterium]